MHREISHADSSFAQESRLSLYLFTGLLGLLIGIDLWPALASWVLGQGFSLPTWPREILGWGMAFPREDKTLFYSPYTTETHYANNPDQIRQVFELFADTRVDWLGEGDRRL